MAYKDSRSTAFSLHNLPAYLPGAASLIEQLDQRLLIVLRDGRHLVGKLKSFDQFMNLMLDDAAERVTHNSTLLSFLKPFLPIFLLTHSSATLSIFP